MIGPHHEGIERSFNRLGTEVGGQSIPVRERHVYIRGEGIRDILDGVVDVNDADDGVHQKHGERQNKNNRRPFGALLPTRISEDVRLP